MHVLQGRDHHGQELHDDGSGDIRADAEHDDGEARYAAAGKEVEKAEELVAADELLQAGDVDARDRNGRQEAEDDERANGEEQATPERRVLERRSRSLSRMCSLKVYSR